MVHARDDNGQTFSDDDIVHHMNFMWFASHDTTTPAMAIMAWGFAAHPNWQDRAYEESASIGDYFVPADTFIAVMNPATHRLEGFWDDPEAFDPARFEGARSERARTSASGTPSLRSKPRPLWHRLLLTRRFDLVVPGYQPPMGWKALPEPLDDLPVRVSPR